MIPAKSTVEIDDKMPSIERVKFGIKDPRKMMRMGARQYSDPVLAMIRELACNAYDTHVEAGTDKPIDVILPSIWKNQLIVQDYGMGMDRDIFRDVYTQFGFSTKETTNDQTGSLGLGSKSPLAYTETFSVSSVRDGYKTSAIVTRQPDWDIFLDVIEWKKSSAPNGTRVTVEVEPSRVEEFKQKALGLFKFWLPGRVRLSYDGGETWFEPEHHVGNQIADNLYEAKEWNMSWVVMGNVPYRIINSHALFSESKIDAMNFVAYVPMSEEEGIDFTPSREDLEYTERTKSTLRKVIKDFEEKLVSEAEGELAGAKTHADAYEIYTRWSNMLGGRIFSDLTFKGDKFTNSFDINAMRYERDRRRNGTWRIQNWRVDQMDNAIIITGAPGANLNNGHKTKARDWADHVGIRAHYFLFTEDMKVDSPWVDRSRIVTWEKVKTEAPKKVRDPNGYFDAWNAGRIPGSWDYFTIAGYKSEQELPTSGKVYWISTQDANENSISDMMTLIGLGADAAVIKVPGNRLAKFQRENPKVENFLTFGRTKVNMKPVDLLSLDAKLFMSMTADEKGLFKYLDETKIKDPEFKRIKKIYVEGDKLHKKYDEAVRLASHFGLYYTVKRYESIRDQSPMHERYPLLDKMNFRYGSVTHKDDIYLYMNAKFKELKKEGKV